MISIIDIMRVAEGFVRPLREGEEVLKGGMVVTVGLRERVDRGLKVQALVLRTSGVNSQHPYVVNVFVDMSKPLGERVLNGSSTECGCPSGNSQKCKHVVAVLLYLSRMEESDLEDMSCTDVEQQWGILKCSTMKEYEAKRAKDLCHVKPQNDVYANGILEVTSNMETKWINRLTACAPLSEFALFHSGLRQGARAPSCESEAASLLAEREVFCARFCAYRSWRVLGTLIRLTSEKLVTLNAKVLAFYKQNVEVTHHESTILAMEPQGTKKWMQERNYRLFASKARSQFTYSFNSIADWPKRYHSLYHSTFKGNEDTIRGLKCEGIARETYTNLHKCSVKEVGLLVREELPWLCASLDGVVVDDRGHLVRSIEIKSIKEGSRLTAQEMLEMAAIKTLDENGNMKKNNDHYAQIQIGMLLSGLGECDYLVYSEKGDDFVVARVQFDEAGVSELCSRLLDIYFDIFLPQIVADHVNPV